MINGDGNGTSVYNNENLCRCLTCLVTALSKVIIACHAAHKSGNLFPSTSVLDPEPASYQSFGGGGRPAFTSIDSFRIRDVSFCYTVSRTRSGRLPIVVVRVQLSPV